jgi:hypothetical protein
MAERDQFLKDNPQVLIDPIDSLVVVGKQNTQLHEELLKVYDELDRYRTALTVIADGCTADPARTAKAALANRSN